MITASILSNSLLAADVYQSTISDYKIQRISTDMGLSQSSVLSFYKDKNGFVWIGTKNGLNRYDGYGFTVFKSNPNDNKTLSNNEIIYITADSDNNLYLGTRGGGLCKFIANKNQFERLSDAVPSSSIVNYVGFDQDSNLWIGYNNGLIYGVKSDTSNNKYSYTNVVQKAVYQGSDGHIIARTKNYVSVNCIYQISKNIFLVGSDRGLFLYKVKEAIFRQIDLGNLSWGKISSIVRRGDSEYFIGTSDGLALCHWNGATLMMMNVYSATQPTRYKLTGDCINALYVDAEDMLWGGTRGGGLFSIDTNMVVVNYSYDLVDNTRINDNIINSLFVDDEKMLWIGTENHGCNLLNLNRKKISRFDNIQNFPLNINDNMITALTGDGENTLYAGSTYNSIYKIVIDNNRYQLETIPLTCYADNLNGEILSLYLDQQKNLWIGSLHNSVARLDAAGKLHTYTTEGYVFSIYGDEQGYIWIGTWGGGFYMINPKTNTMTSFANQNNYQPISSDRVLSFAEDRNGNLWIGTKGGGVNVSPMALLTQGLSNFVAYSFDGTSGCLSNNDVYCMYCDSRGTMWIGTGNGLNRFVIDSEENPVEAIMQNKGTFVTYTEAEGLPNSTICGITEDDNGYLWVSTISGVARISLTDYSISSFSKNDGLQSDEFHANVCYKNNRGTLFLGGNPGMSFFNPNEIVFSDNELKTRITGLRIQNEEVLPGKEIMGRVIITNDIGSTKSLTLWPKHKDFIIEFSAMHYANIDNTRYAYRLKGFDDDWRITAPMQHSATYTNIREGHYTFQVCSINSNGKWSDKVTELKINIKPVLWRNPWFFIIYLILIAVLLIFFRKYSIININERNKLQLEAYEKKKTEELTSLKMRFFTNISHEIRTPLSLIYGPLDNILQTQQLKDDVRRDLTVVKKNVVRLLSLTNRLLELRKIDMGMLEPKFEEVHFIPYIKDILEYFEQQLKNKDINTIVKFDIDETNDVVWIDKEMITTAIYNLISNAFKYTPANNTVSISLSISDKDSGSDRKDTTKKRQYLNITISDTGIGIPEDELKFVFERFYQASNQSATGQAGSGIGLAIVKEYVELHDGIVLVESKKGKGTTFVIQLPLGKEHLANKRIKEQEQAVNNGVPELSIQQNMSLVPKEVAETELLDDDNQANETEELRPQLLIVDDDKEMLSFLSKNLEKTYRIITATNGKKAWNIIQSTLPDMVISDIMMPEIDGRQLCSLIKSNIETSHIPVILLTAHASNDDIIKGYSQGADRYISKPFAMNVLEAQIAQLIMSRKQLIDLYSQKILLKPREITITTMDEKFLTKIMDVIEDHLSDTAFDVQSVVDLMNMSHSSILKKIKALTGVSLVEFVRRYRLNKAAMILEQQRLPITEVAYMTGFSDPKYFSKCFGKQFGKSPTEYVNEMMAKKESEK